MQQLSPGKLNRAGYIVALVVPIDVHPRHDFSPEPVEVAVLAILRDGVLLELCLGMAGVGSIRRGCKSANASQNPLPR